MLETAIRIAVIGLGATLVLDLWSLLLKRFGIPSFNFSRLGRWLGHLHEGRWVQPRIADAPPVKGETWIGWTVHYAIGVAFAFLLIAVSGTGWLGHPTFLLALTVGVMTVVAPLFVLQPALGAGIASSKTKTPWFNRVKSMVSHAVFGLGLYLTALAASALLDS